MRNEKPEIQKLKELIESSGRILITSHISTDADSISSVLLLGTTLITNFPEKQVHMVLEEEPIKLDFLDSYDSIEFGDLNESLTKHKPDLFILLDGNNYNRASRHNGDNVRKFISSNGIKTVVIDHHELTGKDEVDLFINQHQPATVQTIYEILFKKLQYKKLKEAAKTALVGYYADTGGFVYLKDGESGGTFDFIEELIRNGADIEETKNLLSQYTEADMRVIGELAVNISHQDDYTYSFISDDFISEWLKTHSQAELQRGTGEFLDSYIRNINKRSWGFIIYRNTLWGDNIYSVSLRAINGIKDVSSIANALGGGGHKPASGAKFEAGSIEDAIAKVKAAINAQA
ncbi:DHH family phosphoesterase [Candidatus Saccharibacteria bacterium]|nr:DHH family phosphoesterase [Candidatus Saccharibacteria bacterium]